MKLYHLFPDLMNLYGDYGNLVVLKKALEDAGEPAEIVPVHPGDHLDLAEADFLYMGPGTEPARDRALHRLRTYLDPLRTTLLTRQVPALFTGNAWSLLGQTITVAGGTTVEGLGIYPYATVETRDRYTGDAIAIPASPATPTPAADSANPAVATPAGESITDPANAATAQPGGKPLPPQPAVGFLNRCDKVTGVETPLFSLTMGKGNDGNLLTPEGFTHGNFYATHLTGPLLVKNPHLLNFFVSLLGVVPAPIDETSHPTQAYRVTLQALQARLAN